MHFKGRSVVISTSHPFGTVLINQLGQVQKKRKDNTNNINTETK